MAAIKNIAPVNVFSILFAEKNNNVHNAVRYLCQKVIEKRKFIVVQNAKLLDVDQGFQLSA